MIMFSDLPAHIIAEIEGQQFVAEKAKAPLPSSRAIAPGTSLPRAKRGFVSPIEGHNCYAEKAMRDVPSSRAIAPGIFLPLSQSEIIDEIIAHGRARRHIMVSQLSNDRRVESFLALGRGITPQTSEEDRRKQWAAIVRMRKMVERGQPVPDLRASEQSQIMLNAVARSQYDQERTNIEKQLTRLVRALPIWSAWAQPINGLGELSIASIIGHAGDLSHYPSKSHLWKRFGVAVIEGERQRKCTDPEKAEQHGYSPQRRSALYVIGESLFRAQWRGRAACLREALATNPDFCASEHAEADFSALTTAQLTALAAQFNVPMPNGVPTGLYGQLYAHRRSQTADREGWSPAHQKADALRYMTKKLLSHARSAWIANPFGASA